MMILQYQFIEITPEERLEIPEFNAWLCDVIYSRLNTKINRKKIGLRLNYILENVPWVTWKKDKYNLTISELMGAIHDSLICEEYKNNLYQLRIDTNILIPHSVTSVDRLIRFINYGDNKQRATGMFSNLEHEFNHKELNNLWQLYLLKNGVGMTDSTIIAR